MNLEKVIFGFFIVLAATLNFGFFVGDIDNPVHHDVYELFAALVVSLIATVLKFGERSLLGSTMLATSLVADVQLIAASIAWVMVAMDASVVSAKDSVTVVSLVMGAMVANVVSVTLLVIETASLRR